MRRIIQIERSIIPACDVSLDLYERIVKQTSDIEKVGAYKIGFELGLTYGLPKIVELTREYTDKPIIYDHQKAGTDIPNTGWNFAKTIKNAGVDAVIIFPQAGPKTQERWIQTALEQDLGVIVGGLMTHPGYLRSEGGYLADEAVMKIYKNAAESGVSDFVVPGNKPDYIKSIRDMLEQNGVSPTFYAPGFVLQGGVITEAAKVAGNKWHAIIGGGIYNSKNIRKTTLDYASQI